MNDKLFITIAREFAKESKCALMNVAAIAVRDGHILYTGINGTPKGYENCCDHFEDYKYPDFREEHHGWSIVHELHAEQNMIGGASKLGISLEGATVYLTTQPCKDCAKLMIAAGIKEIVYDTIYDKFSPETGDLLKECRVILRRFEDDTV